MFEALHTPQDLLFWLPRVTTVFHLRSLATTSRATKATSVPADVFIRQIEREHVDSHHARNDHPEHSAVDMLGMWKIDAGYAGRQERSLSCCEGERSDARPGEQYANRSSSSEYHQMVERYHVDLHHRQGRQDESARLNRFERQNRDRMNFEDHVTQRYTMPLLHNELKFRSDFQGCFQNFPLEKAFARMWDVNDQYRSRAPFRQTLPSSRSSEGNITPDDIRVFDFRTHEKTQPLFLETRQAEHHAVWPVNDDGSPMAELYTPLAEGLFPTPRSPPPQSHVPIAKAGVQAIGRVKRTASDQFHRSLSRLRTFSWARRVAFRSERVRSTIEQTSALSSSDDGEMICEPSWHDSRRSWRWEKATVVGGDGMGSHGTGADYGASRSSLANDHGNMSVQQPDEDPWVLSLPDNTLPYEAAVAADDGDYAALAPSSLELVLGRCFVSVAPDDQ